MFDPVSALREGKNCVFFRPIKTVKLIGLPLVCLAMFPVAGGHWAILQTVAWGQMLVSYSKEAGSLVLGAKKTFSATSPVRCAVRSRKAKRQKSPW